MDLIILVILVVVTLGFWVSAARRKTAVAVRRQAELGRPRVK
jgi:hypothetical protein